MKILFLFNTDKKHPSISGGAIRHIQVLSHWRKVKLTILDNQSLLQGEFYRRLTEAKVTVDTLLFPNLDWLPYAGRIIAAMIFSTLYGVIMMPDVEWVYTDYAPALFLPAVIISRLRRKKLAVVVQLLESDQPSTWRERLYRWLAASADRVIITNPAYQSYFSGIKTTVNGYAIADTFHPITETKKYDLCFVGAVDNDRKGISDFVKTVELLHRDRKVNHALIITQSNELGYLHDLIKEPTLFTILHKVTQHEINRRLNQSKIFFFPSRAESYGLVIGEAIRAGIPAIIRDIPELQFWRDAAILSINFKHDITTVLEDYSVYTKKANKAVESSPIFKATWQSIADAELAIMERGAE